MDDLQYRMIDARLNAGDTQVKASVKIKVSLSTITNLELHGTIPAQELFVDSIEKYIEENQPIKKGVKNE